MTFMDEDWISFNKELDIINEHKKILCEVNHISVLVIDPESGQLIFANKKAKEFYGIHKEEDILDININDFSIGYNDYSIDVLKKAKSQHFKTSIIRQKNLKGEIKIVKILSGPISIRNTKYIYLVIEDITEDVNLSENLKKSRNKFLQYSKLLEGVISGVPDIIGVYKPDRTVLMYNKAGYNFFNKPKKEVDGKKCYEVFGEEVICPNCSLERAILDKKLIKYEGFVSKMNKYVECIYNPVLDDNGQVIFVIEQLRDITEEKILQINLKESEERYRKIVELSLDGILITFKDNIVFANSKVSKMLGMDLNRIIGAKLCNVVSEDKYCLIKNAVNQILDKKLSKVSFDYKFINGRGELTYVEIISSHVNYNGEDAVMSVIRNITKMKNDLKRAAEIQWETILKRFPLENKMDVQFIYRPAKTVSGDFFHFREINEDLVVGILFDVSGKGFSAALNVSAFRVLFNEAASNFKDPTKIIDYLNKKVTDYLGENYIAACCFSLDFKNKEMKIVSGGINNFAYLPKGDNYIRNIVIRAPFLGMFQDAVFDEEIIKFSKGDKFFLFTDGMDPIFMDEEAKQELMCVSCLDEYNRYLNVFFNNLNIIKDDCTLISIEIK